MQASPPYDGLTPPFLIEPRLTYGDPVTEGDATSFEVFRDGLPIGFVSYPCDGGFGRYRAMCWNAAAHRYARKLTLKRDPTPDELWSTLNERANLEPGNFSFRK